MAYGFILFVGGGVSGWRYLECLVVALFLVNNHSNLWHWLNITFTFESAGSEFIFVYKRLVALKLLTVERTHVPVKCAAA